jgi:transposase
MSDISKDLEKKNLILVFDNMDRLPKKKVQELWSSIHVFFCEHSYTNIKVIVPFDREHIKLSFSEDKDDKQYGDDFINKTFNVVYRVSPPILSDWKNYFTNQWKEAFGEEDSLSTSKNVLQIFDLLSEE